MKRLLIINGHPDPRPERFCGALTRAYEHGAVAAGWETRLIEIGNLPLSSIEAAGHGEPLDTDLLDVLGDIEWANRLAIVFPLWFDKPPEALKVIFGHADVESARKGRRAHLIVTMDMPAFAYRSMLRPGAPKKALALSIPGVVPDEPVLIGCVTTITAEQRRQWLETVRGYGRSWLGASSGPSRTHVLASMIDRKMTQWWNGV